MPTCLHSSPSFPDCCMYELSIIYPVVNPVLAIRPRLTTVTSLHHHGMSLTSSTLLVVILCHVTQPRHVCSSSSRVAVAVARKLLCAQVLMSLAWWATYKSQYIMWYPPTMSILTLSTSNFVNSHYVNFQLCQFPLCQFPTMSIPIWSMLIKWTNKEFGHIGKLT